MVSIGAPTAAAGALGIIITVELASDAGGYEEKLATVISGALVAFLTGITYTADKVDAAVGKYIAGVFQLVYVREGNRTDADRWSSRSAPMRTWLSCRPTPSDLLIGTAENRHKRLDYLSGRIGGGRRIEPDHST